MQDTSKKLQDAQENPNTSNTNETISSTNDSKTTNCEKQTKSNIYRVRRGEPITITLHLSGVVSPTAVQKAKMSSTNETVNSSLKFSDESSAKLPDSEVTSESYIVKPLNTNEFENNDSDVDASGKGAPVGMDEAIEADAERDVFKVEEETNHDKEDTNIEQVEQSPNGSAVQTAVVVFVTVTCISVLLLLQAKRWRRH